MHVAPDFQLIQGLADLLQVAARTLDAASLSPTGGYLSAQRSRLGEGTVGFAWSTWRQYSSTAAHSRPVGVWFDCVGASAEHAIKWKYKTKALSQHLEPHLELAASIDPSINFKAALDRLSSGISDALGDRFTP